MHRLKVTGAQLSIGNSWPTACTRANVNVVTYLLTYITGVITITSGTATKYVRCKLRPNRCR